MGLATMQSYSRAIPGILSFDISDLNFTIIWRVKKLTESLSKATTGPANLTP